MPGNDPPPDFALGGVTLPGRTFASVTPAAVRLQFHPDDSDDAERLVEVLRATMTGRTVDYEIR
jgi:hypothetical protein